MIVDIVSPPPDTLTRVELFVFLADQNIGPDEVYAQIEALKPTIGTPAARRLRAKAEGQSFDRADPDMLMMAQAMGLAADQSALDQLFRAAKG